MIDEKFQYCIDACLECAIECESCAAECLLNDDVKAMVDCIRTSRDCADICLTTAKLLARGSKHGQHLLIECAEICDLCAEQCEKYRESEHCELCAEACRICAEECRSISGEEVI